MAGRWKHCEDYIGPKVKDYAKRIQSLKDLKIRFDGFDEKEEFWFSVDGVHFPTQEFRLDPSTKWFDFKSNSSGLVS